MQTCSERSKLQVSPKAAGEEREVHERSIKREHGIPTPSAIAPTTSRARGTTQHCDFRRWSEEAANAAKREEREREKGANAKTEREEAVQRVRFYQGRRKTRRVYGKK